MPPLFLRLKGNERKLSDFNFVFLNKTNLTLRQKTLRVVTIAIFAPTKFCLENFIIFRNLLKTKSTIYDGVLCKNTKLLTKKKLHHRCLLWF